MPTLPCRATPIPDDNAPTGEIVGRALEMIQNTSPFDVTGHPAMSLPCGKVEGLPVGAMLVGRHYAEKPVYQAAHAYEQEVDWRTH
jgi:amidase